MQERRFHFWQQWLFWSSLLFALFGVSFALWGDNPFFHWYNHALAQVFFHSENIPATPDRMRAFLFAPLGGTIAAAYILLAYIAAYPFKRKEKWTYPAIILAYGTWVLIDSACCLYYGMYIQLIGINIFSIIVKALPLIGARKAFFPGKPNS